MPTLYWGPWLAKIRRGGPDIALICVKLPSKQESQNLSVLHFWKQTFCVIIGIGNF